MSNEISNNNNNNKELINYLINNNNKKLEKNKTFANLVNAETYYKLKELLLRERIGVGDWLQASMEEFILKFGDGNNTCTLDQFNSPDFMVTPAYFKPISNWEKYLMKCPKPDYKKWCRRLDEFMPLEHKVTKLR